MNIKIKSSGVSCLIKEDYDQVYNALKDQLGDSDLMIFSERVAGYEYLQWMLPEDGWIALTEGDPLMAFEVRKELDRRKHMIMAKFGANHQMAKMIMTVPDDDYVYYKADKSGNLIIKLTAWGYRYPERIGTSDNYGVLSENDPKEHTVLEVIFDGQPMAGKTVLINGFAHNLDENGRYEIGDLPLGYEFDLTIDDELHHITVSKGKGSMVFDVTKYTNVDIRATKDNNPYADALALIDCGEKHYQITTNSSGMASVSIPLSLEQQQCIVSINDKTEQQPLTKMQMLFVFDFQTLSLQPDDVRGSNDNDDNNDNSNDNNTKPVSDSMLIEGDKPDDKSEDDVSDNLAKGWSVYDTLVVIGIGVLVALTYVAGRYILF